MGGLGCPAAITLLEGSVSRLVLIDPDMVELSNLQRQVLYNTDDVGGSKAVIARDRLATRFPESAITAHAIGVDAQNIEVLLQGADVVLDGTDDPATSFLINDTAMRLKVSAVMGGIRGFNGLILAQGPGFGPCYRCLFETPPELGATGDAPTCTQAGVLGALAGVTGHLQGVRALAMARGNTTQTTGFVTTIEGLSGQFRDVPLPLETRCPICRGLDAQLDITDETCPITYVRTKIALESMLPGQILDIAMREGEPSQNIPRSLVAEGHEVLAQGPGRDVPYRVVVRRSSQD